MSLYNVNIAALKAPTRTAKRASQRNTSMIMYSEIRTSRLSLVTRPARRSPVAVQNAARDTPNNDCARCGVLPRSTRRKATK